VTPAGRITRRLGVIVFALLTCAVWHTHGIAAQLTLTWVDAATNEVAVSIERSVGSMDGFGEIDITEPGITTYVDAELSDNTTYCYRLRAFNEFGFSEYSDAACGTARAMLGLVVLKIGAGSGTVTSVPAGISCGPSCAGRYLAGTSVTLNATAAAGSTFAGWSGGGCSGSGPCALTLTAATTVSATFNTAQSTGSFRDDFERPDSTALGHGWHEVQGDFAIASGQLSTSGSKTRHLAVQTSMSLGAGRAAADFTSNNNNKAPVFGFVFGYVNAGNYYAAYRQVGGSSLLKIVRVVNGVETVLAQRGISNPTRGQRFGAAVTFDQNQIVLTVAGVNLSASGVPVASGQVGLLMLAGIADNFEAGS
jgi:hypothetical protein